ncbi:putative late blight resistance protein homolog R1A-3 [Coffea arabica]|uniref:Late blight resistance protein homolog R1A-3 n=1 Tax=Coffea arabica TaxID=13443 RepID=A0A6P6TEU2_COFAR|nr:putative late blight resistance protein homolog R1A-3 [Coffea arabica]
MEICWSGSPSCFEFALDYLGWINEAFPSEFSVAISELEREVRLLQSFNLYLTKCRRRRNHETCLEQDEKEVTSFRIQNLIIRRMQDLEFACSERLIHSCSADLSRLGSELTRVREAIKLFFETHIKEPCINFLLEYYWLRDPELVIDFIDSVSKALAKMNGFHFHFGKKLMLLKSFILFAMLRGVKGQQLIDLLIHAEVMAINALHLASLWYFHTDNEVRNQTKLQMSRLIDEKINPGDPQVRETYIHVLTAAKLSRSSDISALEKNKHLVADFMDHLVQNTAELLQPCTNAPVLIMNQMLKLVDGLRFLTILLRHQEKFKDLCHELKNLIGVVACDAAVVIFSLSVNQIEKGLAKETDLALFHLLKVLKFIRAEVTDPVTSVSGFGFPRTNELGSMDFFLENLKELEICNEADDSIAFPKDQIHTVLEDLVFLRSFLVKIADQRNWNGKLQALWSRIMEVVHGAEFVIDSIVAGDKHEYLERVARDIQLLRTEARETYDSTRHDCGAQRTNQKSFRIESKRSIPVLNEVLVGFDDEVKTIIHSLTRGSKLLDFVSIVGMAGLGKTTLANRVYNDPLILSHFHSLARCTVSQVYSMHNLLVQLLCCISSRSLDEYLEMDENDLAHELYKLLKRNRYLIFLDDVWEIKAWNLVKSSLPDDANGSRILFTSRIQLQFNPDSRAHNLRQLTEEESWKLLQKKVFGKESFPPTLGKVGSQIAKLCRGLPLTVVLVAGILANTAEDCWKEVAKSLTSSIVLDDEYGMTTLELSYSHLSDDLKPCLLYFGAFQEDENVPVQRLLWLWISEGFVRKTEEKSLEDVAYDYLKDLVDRSLVTVSEQRTMGGAKACRVHDLVHEFCVKKAKEENFLHILHSRNDCCILTGPSNPLRVCNRRARNLMIRESMPEFPSARSLLSFKEDGLGFWLPKLLRVLDFGELEFVAYFPMEVFLLAHLRYLALRIRGVNFIPAAIANLSRLQTFLLRGNNYDCLLPKTIWNIKTLRHLWTTDPDIGFMFPVENLEVSPGLDHLDTLSLAVDPSSQSLQKTLAKLPSIRRLRCNMKKSSEETTRIGNGILGFDCLSQLESLTLRHFGGFGFKFPLNLKKLTLRKTDQPWSEISTIGKLPNLEVLKLLFYSFGEEWEMKEEEFPKLRVLKLINLPSFRSWTASSDNFPRLEKLVVDWCPNLEEVPSCLGECPTLEMIEVRGCRESVANSVKQIQQEQIDMGNEALKISIEYCVHARSSSKEEKKSQVPQKQSQIPSQRV